MKKLIIGLIVVGLIGLLGVRSEAATDPARIDLYVTPIVVTSLTVDTTYYNFGSVAVRTSTGSTSALTLTNNGSVSITVEKQVFADGDNWDITTSSSVENGFRLWAMVAATQPDHDAFSTGVSSFSKASLGFVNDLTDTAGSQVTMSRDETESLWFRLDMPYSVSTVAEQKIQVRLRATSN